jgi:hypothetical protein
VRRPSWPLLGQLVVSAALLVLLARQIPFTDTLAAMDRLRAGTFAGALGLVLISYAGRARRWAALLARAGVPVRGVTAYCLTLAGVGYGLVTPGRVGEFARILHLDAPRSRTLASAVWDRLTDVLLLEAMSIPAFVLVPAWRGPVLWVFAAVVAATIAGVLALESETLQTLAARTFPFAAGPIARWREASRGTLASRAFAAGLAGGLFYYVFNFAAALLRARPSRAGERHPVRRGRRGRRGGAGLLAPPLRGGDARPRPPGPGAGRHAVGQVGAGSRRAAVRPVSAG